MKSKLKKLWHFIWHEDSLLSWIVNIILAFIIVKFLLYPGLGLILGTSHPVVAVVSSSMEHHPNNFEEWWLNKGNYYENINLTKNDFKKFNFKNGFNKGDLMVLIKAKEIKKGDILVFKATTKDPIIHRVIEITNKGIRTKGDNNLDSRPDEINIENERFIGKAVFKIPFLGWVKLIFIQIISFIIGVF